MPTCHIHETRSCDRSLQTLATTTHGGQEIRCLSARSAALHRTCTPTRLLLLAEIIPGLDYGRAGPCHRYGRCCSVVGSGFSDRIPRSGSDGKSDMSMARTQINSSWLVGFAVVL